MKEPKAEMTEEAVTKLARELVTNLVFMSDQLRSGRDVMTAFMVLNFANKGLLNQWKRRGITHVYEYYSKALPRSINGMPCFTSCYPINATDYKRVRARELEMRRALGLEVHEQAADVLPQRDARGARDQRSGKKAARVHQEAARDERKRTG